MTPRRHRSAAALAGAGALLLSACAAAAPDIVRSDTPRAPVTEADATAGADAVRTLAARLYPEIADGAGDNVVFSPASISTALGMTRAGLQGVSAEQVDALFDTDAETLHRGLNALDQTLAERVGTRENASGEDAEIALRSANAFWGQSGEPWAAPFLDGLATSYGIGVHEADFVADADAVAEQINGWVAERTEDEITELLAPGVLSADTRAVLVNALFLAAPWQDAFSEYGEQPFTTLDGETVSAPSVTGDGSWLTHQGGDWQSVRVPFAGGELAMTVVLPAAGALADVEARLDADLLADVLTGGQEQSIALTMPTLDLRTATPLKQTLEAVGITEMFDPRTRDLEPMREAGANPPLFVSDVLHEATLTLDEEGVRAAAATAVVVRATSGPGSSLVLDRPFLLVLHDVATATPLFLARIGDPTAG